LPTASNFRTPYRVFAVKEIFSKRDFHQLKLLPPFHHIDSSKLEALFATPAPTNVKQLQSFLGICNWFRDFIPDFSIIAHCLTELTKKATPWKWNYDHQTAVLILLHKIANAPCLTYFDPDLETHLFTDASLYGIGGWLGQRHADGKIHPIAFWSRKLLPAEIHYPTHERELLALVEITKRFRHFILGRTIIARTDHRALEFLQTQPKLSVRQANWVEHLQQFDIIIEYLAGPLNHLADYLSRNPEFSPICPKCNTSMPLSIDTITSTSADPLHPEILQNIPDFLATHAFPTTAGTRENMKQHWT
jgi:hypothetical protein